MVNVGLVIGPSTPSARAAPRTNVVFPVPISPDTSTTSPGRRRDARSAPADSVAAGPSDRSSANRAQADPQAGAGEDEPGAEQRHEPRLGAGAGQLAGRRARLGSLRLAGRARARQLGGAAALGAASAA